MPVIDWTSHSTSRASQPTCLARWLATCLEKCPRPRTAGRAATYQMPLER